MAEHNNYAVDFFEACGEIKKVCPGCKISGGVSNIAFSFRGNEPVRRAFHSAFLHHACAQGMDMGIVNAAQVLVSQISVSGCLQSNVMFSCCLQKEKSLWRCIRKDCRLFRHLVKQRILVAFKWKQKPWNFMRKARRVETYVHLQSWVLSVTWASMFKLNPLVVWTGYISWQSSLLANFS